MANTQLFYEKAIEATRDAFFQETGLTFPKYDDLSETQRAAYLVAAEAVESPPPGDTLNG